MKKTILRGSGFAEPLSMNVCEHGGSIQEPTLKNALLGVVGTMLLISTVSYGCSVCSTIEQSETEVETTYAKVKVAKKYHGRNSQEYKLAKAENVKAWKSLELARELPVSHQGGN